MSATTYIWGNRRITEAQRKALAWLPADGSMKTKPGKVSTALESLRLSHRGIVDKSYGDYGPRGGRMVGYRLTESGKAMRLQFFGDA